MAKGKKDKEASLHVTHEGVTVKVYKYTDGAGRPYYKFHYFLHGKLQRNTLRGVTEAKAREEAQTIAETLAGKNRPVLALTAEDVNAYNQAVDLLKPFNKSLVLAVSEWAESAKLLAPHNTSLETAVRFWMDRNATVVPKPFGEALEEFLREKEQDLYTKKKGEERGRDYHLDFLRIALCAWSADFTNPLQELTARQIDAWLRTQQEENDWENLTRNHYRAALSNLTNWAKTKNYLPATWNEMARVPKAKTDHSEVLVFGPKDAKAIMITAQNYYPQYAAHLAIGFFAGVRSAEIQRMKWGDIYWDDGVIFVGKGKVNAQQRRVPLLPNCRAWLERYRRADYEFICESKDVSHGLMRVAEAAGVEWVPNGLRHSFISFRRVVLGGNLHQLADEAGNSPAVIKKHYSRPVPANDAEAFFAIAPRDSNIIPLPMAI